MASLDLGPGARFGILGGTFNPPHLGHLALARHAQRELALEGVLLMPARLPPHKTAEQDPGGLQRLEMCRLLLHTGSGELGVSALELERDGPSYTVDTLRALHDAHPESPLTFILGADIARTLPSWREPRELLELAELAVALRAGTTAHEVEADLAPLLTAPTLEGRVHFLKMPAVDVSSSRVREHVRRGEAVDRLVGPEVAGYIEAHRLYRAPITEAPAR